MSDSKRKRIWIWVAGIFGGIIIILGIAALIVSARWKPVLSEKIKEGVYNGSHHLYKIDFKGINPVSYTHLDVYKRQVRILPFRYHFRQ